MDIDIEVGLGYRGQNDVVEPLEKTVFVFLQGILGKNQAFADGKIADEEGAEQFLHEVFLGLAVAFGQKGQLQRKGKALLVGVELGQEHVFFKALHDPFGTELRGDSARQGGLPGPDIAFDSQESHILGPERGGGLATSRRYTFRQSRTGLHPIRERLFRHIRIDFLFRHRASVYLGRIVRAFGQ